MGVPLQGVTMRYDPQKHHRRSIRLKGYDYSQPGAYFVTICTQNREYLFGEILNGEMRLNDAGRMVERWWLKLSTKFPCVRPDTYVVMPNHFHGIVIIMDENREAPSDTSLPRIIQWFKTMTTNEYIRGVKTLGWPPFHRRVWQRNYYEHIVRDASVLEAIRTYINDNPAHWELDRYNKRATGTDPASVAIWNLLQETTA